MTAEIKPYTGPGSQSWNARHDRAKELAGSLVLDGPTSGSADTFIEELARLAHEYDPGSRGYDKAILTPGELLFHSLNYKDFVDADSPLEGANRVVIPENTVAKLITGRDGVLEQHGIASFNIRLSRGVGRVATTCVTQSLRTPQDVRLVR